MALRTPADVPPIVGGSKVTTVTSWLAAVLPLILVAVADVWVYLDARRCAAAGSSVFVRIGFFTIDTPLAWLVSCLNPVALLLSDLPGQSITPAVTGITR